MYNTLVRVHLTETERWTDVALLVKRKLIVDARVGEISVTSGIDGKL